MKSLAFYLFSLALMVHSCDSKKEKAENKKPEFEQKIESFNYSPIKPKNEQLYASIVLLSPYIDLINSQLSLESAFLMTASSPADPNTIEASSCPFLGLIGE
jgi:hypothetical protein